MAPYISFLLRPRFLFFIFLTLFCLWLTPAGPASATSFHTITIDGSNDFTADETMPGTSGSTWYMTWDATTFYFGVNATDVSSGSATRFVTLYLDTNPQQNPLSGNGSSTGVLYNTQQPGLPFNADFHFRWRTDDTYINMLDWNNGTSSWTDDNTGNNNFGITRARVGNYIEFSIPRASLGNPTAVYAAGAMINEQAGGEFSFFMFPNSNSEGYDANFTNYHGLILNGGLSPNHPANANCRAAYQVTSTAATGANTLVEAVSTTCNDGTITFNIPANSTITFTSQVPLNRSLFINGFTATNLTVSGGNTHRIFDVGNNATVRMAGFTLSNGNGFDGTSHSHGGAVRVNPSTNLLMTQMTISNNSVNSTSFFGAGIVNNGSLSLTESTVTGNTVGGGIANFDVLNINRSTIYNNQALIGGGIYIDISSSLAQITNSTITNNSATFEGGGIRSGGNGVTLLNNTIVNNTTAMPNGGGGLSITDGSVLMTNNILGNNNNQDCVIFAPGSISTNVNNLIENSTDCVSGATGLIQADPVVSALANNGGPTLTVAPQVFSPAINSGDVATCNGGTVGGRDQRNERRYPTVCDRGAYQSIVVTTTADNTVNNDAVCSLREAITAANSNTASGSIAGECPRGTANSQDTISFFLSGAGVHTLTPTSALPALTGSTGINGLTQPGSNCATNPPTLRIELNGISAGVGSDGLQSNGTSSTIAGLIINRFNGDGVELSGANSNVVICNLIGTNSAGTAASPNGGNGLRINNSTVIQVGDMTGGMPNIIAFNTGRGITIEGSSSAVFVARNSVHSNGNLGLDLAANGVTLNDPGDIDTGPNALQNFPLLNNIITGDSGATSTINGSLSSTASANFRIEFFANDSCDPSTFGEGETFIGSQNVTTDGSGNATFAFGGASSFVGRPFITATATNLSTNNTSEFSFCVQAITPAAVQLEQVSSQTNSFWTIGLVTVLVALCTLTTLAWSKKRPLSS